MLEKIYYETWLRQHSLNIYYASNCNWTSQEMFQKMPLIIFFNCLLSAGEVKCKTVEDWDDGIFTLPVWPTESIYGYTNGPKLPGIFFQYPWNPQFSTQFGIFSLKLRSFIFSFPYLSGVPRWRWGNSDGDCLFLWAIQSTFFIADLIIWLTL